MSDVWWEVCPDCNGSDPARWFCRTCGGAGGWEEDEETAQQRFEEDVQHREEVIGSIRESDRPAPTTETEDGR